MACPWRAHQMIFLNLLAAICGNPSFFSFPTWYKYLPSTGTDPFGQCLFNIDYTSPITFGLIGLAILDILLRLGGMVAFGYLVWGGLQYVLSQGQPDRTKKALDTILNSIIGLVITLVATGLVSFVARMF